MSLTSNKLLQMHRSVISMLVRAYSRPTHKNDPRMNTRYPFIKGDPIHEDGIENLKEEVISKKATKKARFEANQKLGTIKKKLNIFKTESGLQYEKLADGDLRLGRTLLAAKTGKTQGTDSNSNTILLEGTRLIRDAILLGAEPKALYFTDPSILDKLNLSPSYLEHIGLFKILYKDLKTWSATMNPAGLLGVFTKPHHGEVPVERENVLPVTVILDGLRDPGNAGTIIRTAAAVGCERLIAVQGTVNLWESKVLRSAMGGHFSVPLYWGLSWADMHNYLPDDTTVLLADSNDGKTLQRAFDHNINPDEIVCKEDEDPVESSESDNDSDSESEKIEKIEQRTKKMDRERENSSYEFHKVPMTITDYTQVTLPPATAGTEGSPAPSGICLVLGGETGGLSAQAKRFAFQHYGQYVTVPMCEGVDSLNTGVAASVILYELRRRLVSLSNMSDNREDRKT